VIFGEALRQAGGTLRAQPLRTFLTMFGVFWGTASVVFLLAWGRGLQDMVELGFTRMGHDLATVWAGRIGEDYTPAADRRELWLTRQDAEHLGRSARLARPVGAEAAEWWVVSRGAYSALEDVWGVEAVSFPLRGVEIAAGRPLLRRDVALRRRVAVLGADARERILGPGGGVGSRLSIGGRSYEVVGILDRVGTQLWRERSELDDQVWIPLTTLLAERSPNATGEPPVDHLIFRFPGRGQYEAASREVRHLLARRLRVAPEDEEALYVVSAEEALAQIPLEEMQGVFLILAVATLGIGGVGVMNLMIDAVHDRRAEIGVRLAVGARRREVVAQFFLETVAATGVGGLLGVAFGVAGSLAMGAFEVPDLIPVPELRPDIVALALAVMGGVGAAAGVIPAWRAARVDPAEILRAE